MMKLKNCDIYHFKTILQYKKLICFGMGHVLRDFLKDFCFMELEKEIFAIADNKIKECGKFLELNKCSIPLISLKELRQLRDFIILISCADIAGVYQQLNLLEELQDVDCYAVYFIRSQTNKADEKNRHYPNTFRIVKEQKIPKIIHYCWFGKKPIPQKCLRWMESWKRYCPNYEIVQWDESNYDITKNTYMYEAYQGKKWAFVSDYARVDIVYNYGGIYVDVDVELIRNYDELLYQRAFCGIESSRKINLGAGFGAEKGHSILKGVLDLYKELHFFDREGIPDLTSCVKLQDTYFTVKGFIGNGNYQIIDNMTVYPESVLSPKDLYTGEILISERTFSIHHYDASWVTNKIAERTSATKKIYQCLN